MRVSIFGLGYVGAVSAGCLAELGHQVTGVDVNPAKVAMINAGRSPVVEEGIDALIGQAVAHGRLSATGDGRAAVAASEVSIIAVGTPSQPDGAPSLDALDAVVAEIGQALAGHDREQTVVLRSTVPPRTTEARVLPALERHSGRRLGHNLQLAFNPEFLREGSSLRDFRAPPFTIIGAATDRAFEVVSQLYRDIKAPVIRTQPATAEAVKCLSNAFHALKISFANEAGAILAGLGIDVREAMEIFCQDRQLNIGPAYLKPGFAFGGSCLPKDVRALVSYARAGAVEVPLIASILPANQAHIERALALILARRLRKVALFGLAFKPGTDDLRESPLLALSERLIGKGYELRICDPHVEAGRLMGKNREFIEREIPHFERLLAADAEAALVQAEIIVIGHAGEAEIAAIARAHGGRPIIDLQGIPRLAALADADYQRLC